MDFFNLVDFSSWKTYEGFAEGSGRSEKQWLQSTDGRIGLFKWPKTDPITKRSTYEHISEHLAHQIANIINISTAEVDIGEYDNRIGSMSYLLNGKNEELREGAWFILGRHPGYDPNRLLDTETGKYYSLDNFLEISSDETLRRFWIDMMVFDYLIGNPDRHQNNWAFIVPIEDRNKSIIRVRPCPLYDNGSSLCCYINDLQIEQYLGNDILRMNSLIDTKSRSAIRIDPSSKRPPLHSEMVRHLRKTNPYTSVIIDRIIAQLDFDTIECLVFRYPNNLLPLARKKLIIAFLKGKVDLLRRIENEVTNAI